MYATQKSNSLKKRKTPEAKQRFTRYTSCQFTFFQPRPTHSHSDSAPFPPNHYPQKNGALVLERRFLYQLKSYLFM